jgi:hypothetical protein
VECSHDEFQTVDRDDIYYETTDEPPYGGIFRYAYVQCVNCLRLFRVKEIYSTNLEETKIVEELPLIKEG